MLTNLRKVGGSVMMTLSPAFLEELKIGSGSTVDVALSDGLLIIKPISKPQYTLSDLLAECNATVKMNEEDKQWLDAPYIGNEMI